MYDTEFVNFPFQAMFTCLSDRLLQDAIVYMHESHPAYYTLPVYLGAYPSPSPRPRPGLPQVESVSSAIPQYLALLPYKQKKQEFELRLFARM